VGGAAVAGTVGASIAIAIAAAPIRALLVITPLPFVAHGSNNRGRR
jgi:hypothetical protein